MVFALATAGCGDWLDRGPAVATPSVRLDRSALPLGAPLEMTLRFDVSPTAPPFAKDYRVMVHFLFDDGEVMWTYDHDPPTPTREWRPGQRVTYTRRIFVPQFPYIGDVPIVVGLYSATAGDRLRLSGDRVGQRAYKVATLTLEPQPPASFLVFKEGWHRAEYSTGAHIGWRWTGPEASIAFRNPRQDCILYLQLDGRPDLFETPQQVSVAIGDRIIQTFPVTAAEPSVKELVLNAGDFGTTDQVTLTLKVDKTFVPATLSSGANPDTRVLGIRVYHAFLELRPNSGDRS
jgi:hypothetical protein